MTHLRCRGCDAPLVHTVVDLGSQPLANSYLDTEGLNRMEPFFPLHVRVCDRCFLVQLPEYETPEGIFSDYAYFSSFSESWLRHAATYVDDAVTRFSLDEKSHVIEVASNDGYLLQYMVQRGIPSLGVEPAENVAAAAEERGVPTLVGFFGVETAEALVAEGRSADLIIANNVLAHVPDIHDFVGGLALALRPAGTATLEFPHLLNLLRESQFDTIYHEHFSYLSLIALKPIFADHGLEVFDVDRLPTHGGSLRLYVGHAGASPQSAAVEALMAEEIGAGLGDLSVYTEFGSRVVECKIALLEFLVKAKKDGARVVGYGAPAKGNTLLNYCGVGPELLEYTVDRNPHKQGHFLPGTHIPISSPDRLIDDRPDHILILPWNLADEIVDQLAVARTWGGTFAVGIPTLTILP